MKPEDTTSLRLCCGGSWYIHVASWVRAASRNAGVPEGRDDYRGFRTRLAGRQPRV